MKGERLVIENQQCTYFNAGQKKICFMFSGSGYTYDKPLLYYVTQLLVESGFDVLQVHYSFDNELFAQPDQVIANTVYESVKNVVETQLQSLEYESILFVGKSLGTIPIATKFLQMEYTVPVQFINLTPVLAVELVMNKLAEASTSSFIAIGDMDPHFSNDRINRLSQHEIFVVPGANHSLDIKNKTIESVCYVEKLLKEIKGYIE